MLNGAVGMEVRVVVRSVDIISGLEHGSDTAMASYRMVVSYVLCPRLPGSGSF